MLFRDEIDELSGSGGKGSTAAESDFDQLLGEKLHIYQCDHLLGSGGMGRVYLAHHHHLERKCALKILSPRATKADIDYVARFRDEGRAAASLVHPNIITIHAIGEDRGYHFLEMEFVAGRSLQRLVDEQGRQTPLRATLIALRIADAMAAAHHRGIIHRDLKLDNVLLTHQGVPKIADFGLAKRVRSAEAIGRDVLVGTPHYMAPELFTGEAAGTATDVYALGVCYFVLLTGRLPFPARTLGELNRMVADPPPVDARRINPAISLEIAECLATLMSPTAANRPRDAIEAAQLLNAVAGDVPEIETMLSEAFRNASNVRWKRVDERFHVEVRLPTGRRQIVVIERSRNAADNLVTLSSVCGTAQKEFLEYALRLNAEIAHGSLAVREIDDRAMFVMLNSYPAATVDVEEIRRSVLEMADEGDAFEMLLSSYDQH
ncbi:MAG: serine/threonine-protein kinase [Planctomycetaceae bacterium]